MLDTRATTELAPVTDLETSLTEMTATSVLVTDRETSVLDMEAETTKPTRTPTATESAALTTSPLGCKPLVVDTVDKEARVARATSVEVISEVSDLDLEAEML
jgi:hypothetical protein